MKIKNWKLFNESVDPMIEGELEDIIIHFCELTNTNFELAEVYCDGGIYVWKVDDNRSIKSKRDYWDFVDVHKRMALEVGYHFYPSVGALGDYVLFSKYGDLENTFIELLDWISKLKLIEIERPFNNRYVNGTKILYYYIHNKKPLIEMKKYINADGLESLDARKASFSTGEIGSNYNSTVYLDTIVLNIFLELNNDLRFRILKSWLVEFDPLYKNFNLEFGEINPLHQNTLLEPYLT